MVDSVVNLILIEQGSNVGLDEEPHYTREQLISDQQAGNNPNAPDIRRAEDIGRSERIEDSLYLPESM